MLTEQEIRNIRDKLIQQKREYFGDAYELWVAMMELLNRILEIDVRDGPISGDGVKHAA